MLRVKCFFSLYGIKGIFEGPKAKLQYLHGICFNAHIIAAYTKRQNIGGLDFCNFNTGLVHTLYY